MLWLTLLVLLALYILYIFLRPVKLIKAESSDHLIEPPDFFIYSFEAHVHTQFSYDSLGKPEDLRSAMEKQGIDFLIITDHDNDHIKHFCDERMIAGMERKITDHEGKVLGDVLIAGDVRLVAHPFKEKYRWMLEKDRDLLVEMVDLKDDLLLKKRLFFTYLPAVLLLYPLVGFRALRLLKGVFDLDTYAGRYLGEGWQHRVFGGLDHHVKVYIREVGIRFLFPHYAHAFYLMRNFLVSSEPVHGRDDFLCALKSQRVVISFSEKPSLVWVEGRKLRVITPYSRCLIFVRSSEERMVYSASCLELELPSGHYVVYAYLYSFKLGSLYLGLTPLFITTVEVP